MIFFTKRSHAAFSRAAALCSASDCFGFAGNAIGEPLSSVHACGLSATYSRSASKPFVTYMCSGLRSHGTMKL